MSPTSVELSRGHLCLCLCSEIVSLRKVITESTPAESSLSQVIASLEQRSHDLSCNTTGGGVAGDHTCLGLFVCLSVCLFAQMYAHLVPAASVQAA